MVLAVAVGADGSPVSVSWNGDSRRDIIVWMDHRALDQAERINSHSSPVLQFYGGSVSSEMQAPKLLWVKENLQKPWSMVYRWMDLGNWLTYRATGDETRSLSHMEQWRESNPRGMEPYGTDEVFWAEIAMIPEFWLTECGQSATGALLDYIVQNHAAAPLLVNQAASQSMSIYELMNKILLSMAHEQNMPFLSALSQDTHVLPDFHGNRSPVADPKSKGVICGLTLDTSEKHLALLYLATIQGIAYGCPIILPRENENVLLGAAILGAVAAKKFAGVHGAMKALNAAGKVVRPSSDPRVKKYHDAKYQIFRSLYEQQLSHRSTMAQALH
ncbi:FGGY carbohydrate kinase domain-containing protein [Triticum urartu]|uniref:FGGY carbohydrate kinase domain-containing protein n=1 Tax=Triticum urartu TaxID=4572 RepID=M8A351_TRIUA|nr:FGGY carbohydrate kinase domain-containing protein [Triticum urartu]